MPSRSYGFSYSIAKAKATLAAAGYKDTNGDGFVENKDGSTIYLTIAVPHGWSDWMTATQMISDSAKDVGIKVTPVTPTTDTDRRPRTRAVRPRHRQRQADQRYAVDLLPVHLPAADLSAIQTSTNYERYTDPSAWTLLRSWTAHRRRTTKAFKSMMTQLQTTFLQNLPAIPLWYNGMWAHVNTQFWTNWPSSSGGQVHAELVAQLLPDDERRHAHPSAAWRRA